MYYYCTDGCPCEIDCVASFKTFVSFRLKLRMGNDFSLTPALMIVHANSCVLIHFEIELICSI